MKTGSVARANETRYNGAKPQSESKDIPQILVLQLPRDSEPDPDPDPHAVHVPRQPGTGWRIGHFAQEVNGAKVQRKFARKI